MFGYACDETPDLMPAPIYYAHRLVERQAQLRKDGRLPYLRPDAKSQVTMRYVDGKPHSIDTVVLSSQHAPEMSDGKHMKKEFVDAVIEEIIKPVLPKEWLKETQVPDQPDRPLRHRRAAGRLRPDGQEDHRRHVRRRLPRTAAARSRARTRRRSTAPPPTRRATSPRTSSQRASRASVRSRSRTRSASPSR